MLLPSLLQRYQPLIAAATIGAHANAGGGSFRQRDVRFLFELFHNWCEGSSSGVVLPIKNTQISRYLEGLLSSGFARVSRRNQTVSKSKKIKKTTPTYRLTASGLIELLSRMTKKDRSGGDEHFYFLFYFIKNYRERLIELVMAEGSHFNYTDRIKIEELLDADSIINNEILNIKKEIDKLNIRIFEATETSKIISKGLKDQLPLENLIKLVEKKYPYELNSQKPLSQLINSLPKEARVWELKQGNVLRSVEVWMPLRNILEANLRELERLKKIS